MAEALSLDLSVPNQDERTMSILAHVLQLVGWWIAPLIIFLVKRDSKFVSFHALQALLLQVLYMAFMVVFMVGFFAMAFTSVVRQPPAGQHAPPPGFFVFFPLVWLGMMGFWIGMLVIAIVYGIKAGRGEWAEYPVIGRIAKRILKIGPAGMPLQP